MIILVPQGRKQTKGGAGCHLRAQGWCPGAGASSHLARPPHGRPRCVPAGGRSPWRENSSQRAASLRTGQEPECLWPSGEVKPEWPYKIRHIPSFIHLFIHLFILHSFIHSFVYSFIHSLFIRPLPVPPLLQAPCSVPRTEGSAQMGAHSSDRRGARERTQSAQIRAES